MGSFPEAGVFFKSCLSIHRIVNMTLRYAAPTSGYCNSALAEGPPFEEVEGHEACVKSSGGKAGKGFMSLRVDTIWLLSRRAFVPGVSDL